MSDGELPLGLVAIGAGGRVAVELISFFVREDRDANGHEHWGDDQHQDPATQALDDAGTGGGSLGVTQCATLSVTGRRREQKGNRYQGSHDGSM